MGARSRILGIGHQGFDEKTIAKIRSLHRDYDVSIQDLAKRYGCSEMTISNALSPERAKAVG